MGTCILINTHMHDCTLFTHSAHSDIHSYAHLDHTNSPTPCSVWLPHSLDNGGHRESQMRRLVAVGVLCTKTAGHLAAEARWLCVVALHCLSVLKRFSFLNSAEGMACGVCRALPWSTLDSVYCCCCVGLPEGTHDNMAFWDMFEFENGMEVRPWTAASWHLSSSF